LHVVLTAAPRVSLHLPASHVLQSDFMISSWYLPVSHSVFNEKKDRKKKKEERRKKKEERRTCE
jgi:hypothetical protein